METKYSNYSVLPEVFTVTPGFHKSKLTAISVTPIRRLNVLDAEFLPSFNTAGSIQNITLIQLDSRTRMEWGSTSYYVKIQKRGSASYKLGVLFQYDAAFWGIYYLHRDLKLRKLKDMEDEIIEERSTGIVEVTDAEEDKSLDLSNFSMHPPRSDVPNDSPLKDDKNTDPGHYIIEKYYSALYSNADLMFFAKSTFTRLKLLCGSDSQRLEQLLTLPVLEVDKFNARYEITNKAFFAADTSESVEAQLKSKFFETNLLEKDDERASATKKKLKIREIKLQMIILLELVIVKKELDERPSQPKLEMKKKRSLVRKKNKQRQLVPTLAGTLVDPSFIEETTQQELTLDLCKSGVRKYLDMLIVLNSLGSETENDGKQSSDVVDFLANIIVPFYYKKLMTLCKELIKTVKGVSMKRKQKKASIQKLPSLQPGVSLASKPRTSSTDLLSKSSISPALASLPSMPSLVRSNKSGLDGFLMDKPSLKRSSSMISSTKALEKRTIDFSSTTSFKSAPPVKVERGSSQEQKLTKGIFGTIAPKKGTLETVTQSVCEIGETPVKKQKSIVLDFDGSQGDGALKGKLFEIAATPDNKWTRRDNEVVKNSETIGKQQVIGSSPVSLIRNSSVETAVDTIISPVELFSSPIQPGAGNANEIASSPFRPPSAQKSVPSAIRRKQRDLKATFQPIIRRKYSGEHNTIVPGSPVIHRFDYSGTDSRALDGSPFQKPKK